VTTGLKLLAVLTRKTAAEKKNQIQGTKRDFRIIFNTLGIFENLICLFNIFLGIEKKAIKQW